MSPSSIELWQRVAPVYDLQLFLERPALRAAIDLATPAPADRVLDVGTGTGAVLRELAQRGIRPAEAVGVDASSEMLARARAAGLPAGWRLEQADARRLPFEAETFDLVFVSYLLNVLSDAEAADAVREARRVLVSGGRLVVVSPVEPRSVLARPYRLLAAFSRRLTGVRLLDPEPLVRGAGFRPMQSRYVGAGYPSVCLLAAP